MQLRNIQQQTTECVEVYYERLLKLINCFQVRATYAFLTTIFKACLLPYLILTTTSKKRNTLIEHKEVVVCEENGLVNLNYNVLLTTQEANVVVKHVISIVIVKSTLTCTNCGKSGHSVETCHNMKKKVPVVLTIIIKST
jgi:hypothetical protein